MPATTDSDAGTQTGVQADFILRVEGYTSDDLRVTAFEGSEGISELFSYRVSISSDNASLPLAELVGKPCTLAIAGANGVRYINGIVRRCERTGEGQRQIHYALEIVPMHWMLTRRTRCRIFQEKSVPDIVKAVMQDAGVPDESYRFALQSTYSPREYVVQYRESDFDFLSRWLEHEGIFFFYEHTATGHVLVFGDSGVAHAATPDCAEFPYRDPSGLVSEEDQEYLFTVRDAYEIQPGAVSLDDFDFGKPAIDLCSTVKADKFTALEISDYPGEFVEKSDGERLASVRLEEHACARNVLRMAAVIRTLVAGYKFSIIEHTAAELNREYVVTRLAYRATQTQSADPTGAEMGSRCEVDIRAIPADVSFRPPRRTPRPVILGSQTAIVVGPSGEEIYCDKYGRVKVQFHWDRAGKYNETSSCWMRVSQVAAGGGYGIMFLPRIGWEVVVTFLEGNPDRPLITGSVCNADHMPGYALPDNKTVMCIKSNSSPGGGGTNEIRLEDSKDKEQLLINASKDMHLRIKNEYVSNVDGDCHFTLKGKHYESFGDSVHTKIKTDHCYEAGGGVHVKATGDYGVDAGGKHSVKTGGDLYLKSGGSLTLEASGTITIKAGGSFITVGSGGVVAQGSSIKLNSGGSAGSGSIVSHKACSDPKAADTVQAGKNTTYNKDEQKVDELETKTVEEPTNEEEQAEQPVTWVELELVDDESNPVPYEPYEVTLPNGRKRRGWLDANGLARVSTDQPGKCDIKYPNRDKEGWRR